VSWDGAHVADTWEAASLLDACEHATAEYWNTANASGVALADGGTPVVQGRIRQARQRANGGGPTVRLGGGKYKLPQGVRRFRFAPSAELLSSAEMVGARVLMRWRFPDLPEGEQLQWCEGIVRRGVLTSSKSSGARGKRARGGTLSIFWFGDPRARETP
jgi:hypothetical protein